MSTERLFLVDPYNDKQLEMIQEFEKDNDLKSNLSASIGIIRASVPKENYSQYQKNRNEIDEDLFIEKNSKITDFCHIHGEKDIKTGKILLAPLTQKENKRRLLSLATEYALNQLGLEEVFIEVDSTNKNLIKNVEAKGYENLGEENGKIIYLKDREERIESQRMIA